MRKYLLLKSQARLIQSKLVSDTAQSSSAIPDSSTSSSVFDEHAVTALASPPVSKKAILFDFINHHLLENNTTIDILSHADVKLLLQQ